MPRYDDEDEERPRRGRRPPDDDEDDEEEEERPRRPRKKKKRRREEENLSGVDALFFHCPLVLLIIGGMLIAPLGMIMGIWGVRECENSTAQTKAMITAGVSSVVFIIEAGMTLLVWWTGGF